MVQKSRSPRKPGKAQKLNGTESERIQDPPPSPELMADLRAEALRLEESAWASGKGGITPLDVSESLRLKGHPEILDRDAKGYRWPWLSQIFTQDAADVWQTIPGHRRSQSSKVQNIHASLAAVRWLASRDRSEIRRRWGLTDVPVYLVPAPTKSGLKKAFNTLKEAWFFATSTGFQSDPGSKLSVQQMMEWIGTMYGGDSW